MSAMTTARGRTALFALLFVGLVSCDGSVVEISIPGATDIQLDSLQFSINDGESYEVEVTVVDSAGNRMNVEPDWESSDPGIASVTAEGVLTGNQPGTVEITASLGDISETATVQVLAVPVRVEYVAGSGQEGEAFSPLPESLAVRVTDRQGDPVPSVEVDFVVQDGGGSASPASTLTDEDGIARATWTLGASGEQAIASVARPPEHVESIPDSMVVFSAVVEAGEPSLPAAVSDLQVIGSTSQSVTLGWTAVADGQGGGATYAVRFGSPTLTWAAVNGTERVIGSVAVGESISYTYTDLQADTEYQFQLVSYRGTLNVDAVFGPLSNAVSVRTESGQVSGDTVVASLTATPSSHTFTALGATQQLEATARNAAGGIISSATLTWTSTNPAVVSVDSNGRMTARAAGTAAIIVTSVCCGASDTVGVTVNLEPPPPPGEALYAEDFEGYSLGALMNTGGGNGFRWNSNGGAVTASNDRAHTGAMSMRLRFDHDWAEQRFDIGRLLPEVWIEYWIWIPENYYHSTNGNAYNNKFFFLWDSGAYPGGAAGKVAAMLSLERPNAGNSDMIMMWSSGTEMMRTGSAPRWSNAINDAVRGKWSRLRYHVRVASPGASDGVFQFWWDDTLRIDSRNLPLRDNGDNAFQRGYLLGAANAEFSELTDFYIDDFRVYASSPEW